MADIEATQVEVTCSCGTVFPTDANFCRSCGKKKGAKAAKPKAKGKAKGKGKGKGKGKAKGKARAAAAAAEVGPDGEVIAKPKGKVNLKTQVMDECKDRDIDDVIAEAKAKVYACEATIAKAEAEEKSYDKEMADAKAGMDKTNMKVEEAKSRESIALEKLKASRSSLAEAQAAAREAVNSRLEEQKKVIVLESELTRGGGNTHEFEVAKKAAREAMEAAKKALFDAKIQEKEAAEKIKQNLKAAGPDAEKELKEKLDALGPKEATDDKKDGKGAAKAALQEMKDIGKMQLEREKVRQQKIREAQGLLKIPKQKRTLAIGDGAAPSPAAKRANNVDVD